MGEAGLQVSQIESSSILVSDYDNAREQCGCKNKCIHTCYLIIEPTLLTSVCELGSICGG